MACFRLYTRHSRVRSGRPRDDGAATGQWRWPHGNGQLARGWRRPPGFALWQVRYDLDLTGVGFNGFSLYGLHARGYGSDGSKTAAGSIYTGLYGRDGRDWETDLGLAYRIKDGPLAGLALRTSQAWHRGNRDYLDRNVDETRLTVDYPLANW
ncbi:OprD family outer membrane porin [Pseudomonas protegens]|uniref:OprD family outer membrane porin n=1 Tax=Pseudomonas protegens TaxID=380021 RepID=UPI001F17DC24|nr:OprD family outer membrane porin [Pseudomonas protegens]